MTTRISYAQRVRIFGVAGNRRNTVTVRTPWGMSAVVHRLIAEPFMDACNEAATTVAWRPQRCDSFVHRPIRNALSLSFHSWALACDWFSTPPGVAPPGGVWTPTNAVPASFARCFERRGFYWGARFARRRDVPHIEWPGGLPSAPPPPVVATPPTTIPTRRELYMQVVIEAEHPEARWLIGPGVARHITDINELGQLEEAWGKATKTLARSVIANHAVTGLRQ